MKAILCCNFQWAEMAKNWCMCPQVYFDLRYIKFTKFQASHHHTQVTNSWCWVFLKKPEVSQLFKKSPLLWNTKFRCRIENSHLYWVTWIESTPSHSLLTLINFTYGMEFLLIEGGIYYERRYRWPSGLRLLACWNCGFEPRLELGYLSVVCVVCCQVEVSVRDWTFVQRSPSECVCVCVCT